MGLNIRGSGRIIRRVGMGNLFILMGMSIKGSGIIIGHMGMGCIRIQMGPNMKGNGWRIISMGLGKKCGRIRLFMKEDMCKGRKKDLGFIIGLIKVNIEDI